MITNRIFRNEDGSKIDCGNRDLLLITYGKIIERMNNSARECTRAYEDYLRMSWGIEAQVNLTFEKDINKMPYEIIEPSFQMSFKTEEDKELFEKIRGQSKDAKDGEI